MAYGGDPANSYIDRLRLRLGDTDSLEILDDQTYNYFYNKNEQNEDRTFREMLNVMLVALSRFTRERAADIEVYSSERFRQFYDAVKFALSQPFLMSINITPYASGISRSDMRDKATDSDAPNKMFYIGMTEEVPSYDRPKDGSCIEDDFYIV